MTRPQIPIRHLVPLIVMVVFAAACGGDEDDIADATASAVNETTGTSSIATDNVETDVDPGDADTTAPDADNAVFAAGSVLAVSVVSGGESDPATGDVRGTLASPGDQHTYTVDVGAGQVILFRQLGCDLGSGDGLWADVEGDSIGSQSIFNPDNDCGANDRFEISDDQTITITIRDIDDEATGDYAFRIVDVTPSAPLELAAGDEIRPDDPSGFGRLEEVGFRDLYTFDAVAGEVFVITQLGDCDISGDRDIWMDIDGAGISSFVAFDNDDCGRNDRFEPSETGTVVLTARNADDQATGDYSFRLDSLGADSTSGDLPIGDAAAPEATDIISGELAAVGEEDIFEFDVVADQEFLIQETGECNLSGVDELWMDIDGAGINGFVVFEDFDDGDCRDNTRFVAEEAGTVRMRVNARDNAGTGAYNFRILRIPVDPIVTLRSGDVVAPDQPAEGAGIIGAVGQQDVYRFDVVDDQVFMVEMLGGCDFFGDDELHLDVEGAGVNGVMFLEEVSDGDCLEVREFEAERAGPVLIRVANENDLLTGTYSFRVSLVVGSEEEAQVILDDLGAVETDEGTVITLDETLLFDFGSSELRPESMAALGRVADALNVYTEGQVAVIGHTDAVGGESANLALSEQRATAVADALALAGADPSRLAAEGRGETEPIADNTNPDGTDNEAGRALNRRVEIIFLTS